MQLERLGLIEELDTLVYGNLRQLRRRYSMV